MEYILFGYIWTNFFHLSINEMVLQFKVAINIEKQGLSRSLQENRNYFPNNPIIPFYFLIKYGVCKTKKYCNRMIENMCKSFEP